MNNQIGLIAKVMLASAIISGLIKYALPYVPVAPTTTNALGIVFLPTIVTIGVLTYRATRTQSGASSRSEENQETGNG